MRLIVIGVRSCKDYGTLILVQYRKLINIILKI